jgi:hypothetical protein
VTEADSPELFYSVANFYGPIFDNILKGTATEEEKWSTINDFLLAEAVIILRSCNRFGTAEEAGRVDYHTTASEWKRIADAAGYRFKRYEPLVRIPNGGRTVNYFMQFEA